MKTVVHHSYGGTEVLQIEEVEKPQWTLMFEHILNPNQRKINRDPNY